MRYSLGSMEHIYESDGEVVDRKYYPTVVDEHNELIYVFRGPFKLWRAIRAVKRMNRVSP